MAENKFPKITEEGLAALRQRIGVRIENTVEPWNYEASRDAIRHYAHGIGDDNPLWTNPEYAEKKDVLVKQIEADIKGTFFSADTKKSGLGWMTKEVWTSTNKILLDQGVIKTPIDVDATFSDKYLAKANAPKM